MQKNWESMHAKQWKSQQTSIQEYTTIYTIAVHSNTLDKTTKQKKLPHNSAQNSTYQHNSAQHKTLQYNIAQHKTLQYNSAQHKTLQYNSAQHITLPHKRAQHSMLQHNSAQHNTLGHTSAQYRALQHTLNNTRYYTIARHNTSHYTIALHNTTHYTIALHNIKKARQQCKHRDLTGVSTHVRLFQKYFSLMIPTAPSQTDASRSWKYLMGEYIVSSCQYSVTESTI